MAHPLKAFEKASRLPPDEAPDEVLDEALDGQRELDLQLLASELRMPAHAPTVDWLHKFWMVAADRLPSAAVNAATAESSLPALYDSLSCAGSLPCAAAAFAGNPDALAAFAAACAAASRTVTLTGLRSPARANPSTSSVCVALNRPVLRCVGRLPLMKIGMGRRIT